MQGPGPPGWGLDTRLMTLLCKIITVAKPKEIKNLAESAKEGYDSKMAVLPMMMMMMMITSPNISFIYLLYCNRYFIMSICCYCVLIF
jgi:hypothetical protein